MNFLEILHQVYHDVGEELVIQFFILILLSHLIAPFLVLKKDDKVRPILIGVLIAFVQVLIMLVPARLGNTVTFDISSIIIMYAFGFFGYFAGYLTLAVTIVFHFIKMPPHAFLYLVLYAFAAIAPQLSERYVRPRLRKKYQFMSFYTILLINSLIMFGILMLSPDSRNPLWVPLIGVLVLFPLFGLIIALFMNEFRVHLTSHSETEAQERLQRAMINAPRGMEIFALDQNYDYLSFNDHHHKRFREVFNGNAVVGKNFLNELPNPAVRHRLESTLSRALSGETFDIEVEIENSNGLFLHDFYNPIFNEDGEVIGVTVFSYEITKRKQYEKDIKFFSYHDKLTGLYNRRFFDEYADSHIENPQDFIVIYADINGLKIMNDLFGHESGDLLIITLANALRDAFSDQGIVARTGGDEIVSILAHGDKAKVDAKIEEIRAELLAKTINDIEVSVSFSSAIAHGGKDIMRAQQEAEELMYQDKDSQIVRHRNNIIDVILFKINELSDIMSNDYMIKELTQKFSELLNISSYEQERLSEIIRLRMIGMAVLSEEAFSEASALTNAVKDLIRKKITLAYRMILITKELNLIAGDVISIYENFDGSGVPRGLREKEIPYKARIVRIVSDFTTLTEKNKLSKKAALAELEKGSGTKYDPLLIDNFKKII